MHTMMTHDEINLITDWQYNFISNKNADYSKPDLSEAGWIPLPELADWSVTNSVQSGADWFRKHFTLTPTEGCVRYALVLERAPEHLMLYVNGANIGSIEAGSTKPLELDITERVALGVNVLAMKLTSTTEKSGGKFGRIYLKRIFCDS